MKFPAMSAALMGTMLLAACGGGQTEEQTTADAPAAATDGVERVYYLDADASKVRWKGSMPLKSHDGVVNFQSGKIAVKDGIVVAGHFTVDLTTIRPTDDDTYDYQPAGSEKGTKAHLIGHLKSADFFDVENHPNAIFELREGQAGSAVGEFTLRDNTHKEVVEDIVVREDGGRVTATGKLVFDRQKYDVSWSSGIADAVLSDKIELQIEFVGTAPEM
jgi:polyisoprenoid-binding protein YceI